MLFFWVVLDWVIEVWGGGLAGGLSAVLEESGSWRKVDVGGIRTKSNILCSLVLWSELLSLTIIIIN